MTNEEFLREFNALPAEARREAEGFIAFLKKRYSREAMRSADGDLLDEPFVGMWRDSEWIAFSLSKRRTW